MVKKRYSATLFKRLLSLLLFLALNIILIIIYGSFGANPTQTRDSYIEYEDEEDSLQKWKCPEPTWSITCDRSHYEYDLCYINRPLVLELTTMVLHSVDPTGSTPAVVEKIRPYPRKWQPDAMEKVKEVSLTISTSKSSCTVTHVTPALVFSVGGFTGNIYHAFSEAFIPLFVTVESLFPDRNVILVIVDGDDTWLRKYDALLRSFTRHSIINVDKERAIHCFPYAIVGLLSHGQMTVDPTVQKGLNPKTVHDFRAVLANTYSHTRSGKKHGSGRPRLVLMSRSKRRVITNQDDVVELAKDVGFDVVVIEPNDETSVQEMFRVVESCHVMIGVHGAGLTNELFLRPGSVFMQIVPIKNNWLGDICYGKLAVRLGLEYFVYNLEVEESSLFNKYPKEMLDPNEQVLDTTQPNWGIYVNQNVTLNLNRFRIYLRRAYVKANRLMLNKNSLFSYTVSISSSLGYA